MCCTSKGYEPMEALEGKDARVWDGARWVSTHVEAVEMCGLVTVVLSNGVTLTCTPNVALRSSAGSCTLPVFADAGALVDCVSLPVVSGEEEVLYPFLQGVYCASGALVPLEGERTARVLTLVGKVASEVEQHTDVVRTDEGIDFPRDLPTGMKVPLSATLQDKAEWLSGLLSARYHYNEFGMCFSTPSVLFARDLQLLLFSLGVHARVVQGAPLCFHQRMEGKDLAVSATLHQVEVAFDQMPKLAGYGFRHHDVRPGDGQPRETRLCAVADLRRVGKAYSFRDGEGKTFVLNGVVCMPMK